MTLRTSGRKKKNMQIPAFFLLECDTFVARAVSERVKRGRCGMQLIVGEYLILFLLLDLIGQRLFFLLEETKERINESRACARARTPESLYLYIYVFCCVHRLKNYFTYP